MKPIAPLLILLAQVTHSLDPWLECEGEDADACQVSNVTSGGQGAIQ